MRAKDLKVKPISAADAKLVCIRHHYSRKVVPNSQLHFGVFLGRHCEGVMSFGPSMNHRAMCNTVPGSKMNEFMELNRMAFSEKLPKNSESRAISIAMKIIKRNLPAIKWVVSFADATQCGDGTIYRAAGFKLIDIKKNTCLLRLDSGRVIADKTLNDYVGPDGKRLKTYILNRKSLDHKLTPDGQRLSGKIGATPLPGFQIKYVYFLDKGLEAEMRPHFLPYSEIKKRGAKMYKGVASAESGTSGFQSEGGGANPTAALQAGT